jgi:hypothetical protein
MLSRMLEAALPLALREAAKVSKAEKRALMNFLGQLAQLYLAEDRENFEALFDLFSVIPGPLKKQIVAALWENGDGKKTDLS